MAESFCASFTRTASTQAGALALLCGACATAPKPPRAHHVELLMHEATIDSQDLKRVELTFPWELDNGGVGHATVDRIRWTFEVDGYPPLSGEQTPSMPCPASASVSEAISVAAFLRMLETPQSTETARDAGTILGYRMTAEFHVNTIIGPEAFEAQWHGEFFAPRRPSLTVHTEAARYGSSTVEFHFAIGVENPNPFPLPLSGLDYRVYVDEVEVTQGRLAEGDTVGPGAELQFEVTRLVGREDHHELARALSSRQAIMYRVENELHAADHVFAQPLEGEIYFAQ